MDEDAMRYALAAVVARHEQLRTCFVEDADGPVAVVEDVVESSLTIDDLRALPLAERRAEADSRCAVDVRAGFVLARAPLLRARLLRLGEDDHELVLIVHHIVFDGASLDVLLNDLGQVYSARVRGTDLELGAPACRFADAVGEEQELLAGSKRAELAAFWRNRLEGAPPVVLPPPDRDPTAAQKSGDGRSWAAKTLRLPLPERVVGAVRQLAQVERATPYSVYLAVLYVLLARLTGREDVVVGTPVSNRRRLATAELVGFFVNVVVDRARVHDQSFMELVRSVRESVFDALDHQRLPFEVVVDEVRSPRISGYGPLFQVLFAVVAPFRGQSDNFAGLEIGPIEPIDNGRSPFALTVSVLDGGDTQMELELSYAEALYDDATAARIARQFAELLSAATSHPARSVRELGVLAVPVRPVEPQAPAVSPVPVTSADVDAAADDDVVVAAVRAVWAMHLHTEVIDPDADFTALGGHSLAAARIAVDLRELFGLKDEGGDTGISEFTLFRAPTPRLLAERIATELGGWPAAQEEAKFVLELLTMSDEQATDLVGRPPQEPV